MSKRKYNFFENEAECDDDDSRSEFRNSLDDYDLDDSFIATDELSDCESIANSDIDCNKDTPNVALKNCKEPTCKKKRGRPFKNVNTSE